MNKRKRLFFREKIGKTKGICLDTDSKTGYNVAVMEGIVNRGVSMLTM